MKSINCVFGIALLAMLAGAAQADDGLRDLCPDRPGKGTSACTLDAGHFQIETDIIDETVQHSGTVSTHTWLVADPNLKYGVSDSFDIEASLAPYESIRTRDTVTRATQTLQGIGDLFLRGKWAAVGNGGADFALALEPYIKLPTARTGIGNGVVEGGLVMPVSLSLGDGWSLSSTPELDILKNGSDNGRHASFTDVVGIGRNICDSVVLGAELWESSNFDPAGTSQSYSFDIDATWQTDSETQLDAGLNLGLNHNTPGSQIYAGISRRF